ncbi:tRNA (cytosine-5-)-methyltransferase [Mortierella claussenii]|nr:tRNA (cytosine-5-)-methyltransferase [Mortierella claussenii]
MANIRALEFFSGIGGLHFGFIASGANGEVLESFDMNQQANQTYKKSFGKAPITPYTRGGKLLDDQDNRAKPLLHLLDQLEIMTQPPIYLFLENVKNFETSRSRERLISLIHRMGYVFRECLLAPHNFGVPNDRLRYFLMARLRSSFSDATESTMASDGELFDPEKETIYTTWPLPAFVEDPKILIDQHKFELPELRRFLDPVGTDTKDYLLSKQLILERPNFRFDILQPSSSRSSCFTKAYGSHHVASGGGLLQTLKMDQTNYDFSDSEAIAELGLRFFTPTEVARLHVFPLKEEISLSEDVFGNDCITVAAESGSQTKTTVRPFNPRLVQRSGGPFLEFPNTFTALPRYKLLGNSLNVWVVAELLRGVLFAEHAGTPLPMYQTKSTDNSGVACDEGTPQSTLGKHSSEGGEQGAHEKDDLIVNVKRPKTE